MALDDKEFARAAEKISKLEDPRLRNELLERLLLMAGRDQSPNVQFDHGETSRINPGEFSNMKKVDAMVKYLRKVGGSCLTTELTKALRNGNCPMPRDQKNDWQVCSVVLANPAHRDKFAVVNNHVYLLELQHPPNEPHKVA